MDNKGKKKRGYDRSRTTDRIVTWELNFWNEGVKIRRNSQLASSSFFFSRAPHTHHFGPFLAGKGAKLAFEGT